MEYTQEVILHNSPMFTLGSPIFQHGGKIPVKYTCNGENINPPLEISGVPANAQSLVLIVDDPDVPKNLKPDGLWVHWLVWNIPPETLRIEENSVPAGVEGTTSFGTPGYGGPCPPDREHRYFFKLAALDIRLKLSPSTTKPALEEAMRGHVLEQCELIGLYEQTR